MTAAPIREIAKRRRSRGQGMVEFALVFPLFLATMLLIFDSGRLLATYLTLAHGVQNGLRTAMIRPCVASDTGALDPIKTSVKTGLLKFGNPEPSIECTNGPGPLRQGVPTIVVTVKATMPYAIDPVFHNLLKKAFPTTITLEYTSSMCVESPASG